MAVVTSSQVNSLYVDSGSGGQKSALVQIDQVTNGDTIDVSSLGPAAFKKVQMACFVAFDAKVAVVASVSGTVITLTLAGMSLDTVNLLVVGIT